MLHDVKTSLTENNEAKVKRTLKQQREVKIVNNKLIRIKLVETGMKYWELARMLGKSDATLSRMLRQEIPVNEQNRIAAMIEEYAKKGESTNE